MRIFVYEFVTGGGLLSAGLQEVPPPSLRREGAAMITALATDFAATEGTHVLVMWDPRFGDVRLPAVDVRRVESQREEAATFDELAGSADWTVVIAPESSNHLLDRCCRVEACGGRLLGPSPEVVRRTSDKHLAAESLALSGLPVPDGQPIDPGQDLPPDFGYPAVLKPRLGAGSEEVRLVHGPWGAVDRPSRLEPFCPGLSASVSMLCGPAGHVALPPCRQRLSGDGRFVYSGGSLPLPERLAGRAIALARQAIEALPHPTGYLGVDLVLGEDPNGGDDKVIEVNPRLTTSYVGLRAATKPPTNLAASMVAVSCGRPAELCFRQVSVEFDADGTARESAR
jgi:predicted ATP-grasp superfamily ATP-dependent carboligase